MKIIDRLESISQQIFYDQSLIHQLYDRINIEGFLWFILPI